MEINVELLLGTKVRDVDGENIGRIEEFRVERDDNSCVVEAYLIGASAVIQRPAKRCRSCRAASWCSGPATC